MAISKHCLKKSVMVCWLNFMFTTFVYQIVGFFTPYWACGEDYNSIDTNSTCVPEGLFYSCNNESSIYGCHPKLLDVSIFMLRFLCQLTNLCVVPVALVMSFKKFRKLSRLELNTKGFRFHIVSAECCCPEDWRKNDDDHLTAQVFYVFTFGQFLAAIALLILRSKRMNGSWIDEWSATLFLYPAVMMALPLALLISILVIACVVFVFALIAAFLLGCCVAAVRDA